MRFEKKTRERLFNEIDKKLFVWTRVGRAESASAKLVRWRLIFFFFFFLGIYFTIAVKLVYYGLKDSKIGTITNSSQPRRMARPDIVDRNGRLLATDINIYSLYAEPHRIVDVQETLELLLQILPDLDIKETRNRLLRKNAFIWIRRGLTPQKMNQIMALGIPGIGFRTEIRRFYPSGSVISHVLGLVNIDNQGIAGIEKYIDQTGLMDLHLTGLTTSTSLTPLVLSIDLRVQNIVHNELQQAIQRYQALAAGAVILDVRNGEILALASLPDFDPNSPNSLKADRFNRMTAGVFEMGSIIKSFTTAMALDSGLFHLNTLIDASNPLRFGRQVIRDFHGKYRHLALWEVFIFSSNIGSGKEAEAVGITDHRAFLERLGLLDRLHTELPEMSHPVQPHHWKKIHSMTIAFGHGMMTTPLQTAVGAASLVNGGFLVNPTFLKRTNSKEQENKYMKRVIKSQTSYDMRYLYRLNACIGSGKRAVVKGYRIGGKTGTAEKVIDGKYVENKRFNTFLAIFPMDDPAYVVLIILDEPKPEKETVSATAGLNAAPIAGKIIRKTASFLEIAPDFEKEKEFVPFTSSSN